MHILKLFSITLAPTKNPFFNNFNIKKKLKKKTFDCVSCHSLEIKGLLLVLTKKRKRVLLVSKPSMVKNERFYPVSNETFPFLCDYDVDVTLYLFSKVGYRHQQTPIPSQLGQPP